MKTKIESKIPEGIVLYSPEKSQIQLLKGREYKRVGKSYETLSNPKRFVKVLEMIGLVGLAILSAFTLFCSEKYRKKIKQISKEIKGQEKIVHVVPFLSDKIKLSAKKFLNDTLNEVEQFLEKGNNELQKVKKVSPINSEIYVKLLIGEDEQVYSYFLKNEDDSALSKDQIHAHIEEIKDEINVKIENATNFYEGMIISSIYKDENNKIRFRLLPDIRPGTKLFKKIYTPTSKVFIPSLSMNKCFPNSPLFGQL